ncbi:MAG: orotidine 5-phosphate decarboxylase [Methanomicrobia archaeon]|nr:orotidine 5-phosphate decarboxylase [Methanomicrobia archaeon]
MNSLFHRKRGVVPACDVYDLKTFRRLIEATYDLEGIVGYKLGALLGLTYGLPQLVNVIREYTDLPVIYDHQKAGTDIPRLGVKFATICADAGITGVILFPQAGPQTEAAFIDALFDKNLVPMVGGEMTHSQYLTHDGGFIRDDAPVEIYTLAAEKGVNHFIVPGTKPAVINQYHRLLSGLVNEPEYSMPGIGKQGGDITSAFDALEGAPAYAIIGASIYEQADMAAAARRFCAEALSTTGSE